MKKYPSFCFFIIGVMFLNIASAQHSGRTKLLPSKEVFVSGFPRTLSFRNDRLLLQSSYENWESKHILFNGITKKYLQEEVNMPPIASQWANDFALKHPDKLMLIHLNGEGRSVNDKVTFDLYFPGHWVYEKGTFLSQSIGKKQSNIKVKDTEPFSLKAYRIHGQDVGLDFKPHDVLIVKLDKEGNRIWDQSEYATIVNIDSKRNEIEVKRGMYGSVPLDFKENETYIAPIAGDIWGGNLMYYYNLSSVCPLDLDAKSAADIFVGEMKDWFGKGGRLEHLDGIGFDVNYFTVKQNNWDCDNDGEIDNGFVDGKNIWREGDIRFLQKIRSAFGPDFIITSDGWRDIMQRAVGIFNGMESEGLCRWNDGYRQISRTINQHTYWNLHNNTKYQFSYITSKLRNPADLKISKQLRRLGLGVASCLGVAYATSPEREIPEILGGTLNQPNWLGQPRGPMRYILGDQKDLLRGIGLSMDTDLIRQFDFTSNIYRVENSQLIVQGLDQNKREDLVIPGPTINVESGDLLIFFEAKDNAGFVDLEQGSLIPRKINIRMEGLPEYPEEPMRSHLLYNELAGFMGTNGYTPQMFYFRNVGDGDLKLIFEAEEQGEFAIKNLQIYNSPCVIAREFENGVVLANPSFESIKVNLDQIFSENIKLRRLDTESYDHQSFNIKDRTLVNLPSLDALFLLKEGID